MTAMLPMSGGGEMPYLVEAPAPKKTRKRKADAATAAEAKPKRRRTKKIEPKEVVAPPALVAVPAPELVEMSPGPLFDLSSVPESSISMTLPGLDIRELAREVAEESAAPVAVQPEPQPQPEPQAEKPDYIPDEPVHAVFAGTKVRVVAIGTSRIMIEHDQPIAAEGDLVLRVPGLFAELSRLGARVSSSEADRTILELTRNAVFATFAIDALRNVPKLKAVEQPAPVSVEPQREPSTSTQSERVLAPTRALPAIFGDARVALLEICGTTMRVAHSKPLPLEGDYPFSIKTDVADFSGSFARLLTWERLQDGRDVYLSTIEITRSALSFRCGIDALIDAKLLQERAEPVADADVPPPPPVEEREVRPLVPVVKIREPRVSRLPRRHPRPSARVIAAAVLVFIVAVFAYVRRPDEHLRRAQLMIDAYESGLLPAERDYSLPVYANSLQVLEKVRPVSVSKDDADELAARIRKAIAQQRQREAIKASMTP